MVDVIPWTIIVILTLSILFGVLAMVLAKKRKKKKKEIDYYAFYTLGISFVPLGIVFMVVLPPLGFAYLVMGISYLIIGLKNKDKWKKQDKITQKKKIVMLKLVLFLGILAFLGIAIYVFFKNKILG